LGTPRPKKGKISHREKAKEKEVIERRRCCGAVRLGGSTLQAQRRGFQKDEKKEILESTTKPTRGDLTAANPSGDRAFKDQKSSGDQRLLEEPSDTGKETGSRSWGKNLDKR